MTIKPLRPPTLDPRLLRLGEESGEPRCLVEQVSQHVSRYRLLWFAALIAASSVTAQLTVDGSLHRLVYGVIAGAR